MVWALGLLWLLTRWLFAVPLLLLGNVRPLEALRATWRETRDNWTGLLRVLGLWWAAVALLSMGLSTLGWFLAGLLFDWAGYLPGRVLGIVVVVLVTTLISGTAISVLGLGIHQFALTRLSLPHLAQQRRPVVPTIRLPMRRRLVRLGWAVLLAIVTLSEALAWLEFGKMDIVEPVAVTAHRGSSARAATAAVVLLPSALVMLASTDSLSAPSSRVSLRLAPVASLVGTLGALINMRDHGVSVDYVHGMMDQGLPKLSPDDLVRARDHGVTPDYVQALRGHGFASLSLDALVNARDHGISPEYVRELRDVGYRLTLVELTRARDHGVSAEYVRQLDRL
jgi:hypothetical protein